MKNGYNSQLLPRFHEENMLLKILNKASGMLLGTVTACFAWPLEILFAYYVCLKHMRLAGYSWPTTLLATLTLGHIGAALAAAATFMYLPMAPLNGLITGYQEGLLGAIRSLFRMPLEIYKHLLFCSTDSHYRWAKGFFNSVQQCLLCGTFSFGKLIISLCIPEEKREIEEHYLIYKTKERCEEILAVVRPMITRLRNPQLSNEEFQALSAQIRAQWAMDRHLYPLLQEAEQIAKNKRLVGRIKGLSTATAMPFPSFTAEEMEAFKSVTHAEKDVKNERLYNYLTSDCLISCDTLVELSQNKDSKEEALPPPITVEGNYPEAQGGGRRYIRTYDYASFLAYIETEKNKPVPIAVVGGSTGDGDRLEDEEHVKIYRGFCPIDAEYIRGEINRWRAKTLEQATNPLKQRPQPLPKATRDSTSAPFFVSAPREEGHPPFSTIGIPVMKRLDPKLLRIISTPHICKRH